MKIDYKTKEYIQFHITFPTNEDLRSFLKFLNGDRVFAITFTIQENKLYALFSKDNAGIVKDYLSMFASGELKN